MAGQEVGLKGVEFMYIRVKCREGEGERAEIGLKRELSEGLKEDL